jgi:hypothetical protein
VSKLFLNMLIMVCLALLSYNVGHRKGLKSAPEFVQMKTEQDRISKLEFDKMMQDLAQSTPSVEECAAVMEGFDGDISAMCSDFFQEEQDAMNDIADQQRLYRE